ncbi:Transcriptional regulator of yeast-form-adherence 3 [Choanephora cucurbitarum]|uniref:Transcriptional regulator of yeast-form-adherence 3 n=1 Tax=Choanephora cucurbitarum TaxID=101091 RepID=A0A1C7N973_9FUNG|nr:Transcriptional regulator of yeast-form-adherence 3 [Choanephora cucurbitarum]
MKFGKQMESAALDLPENWRPHLIHYKSLKKSIRLVVDELEARGLSSSRISTLDTEEAMRMHYTFDGNIEDPQPYIKITINDPTAISEADEYTLTKLTSITEKLNNGPLSIKIQLVRDSEFFHLLLHELSHAALLHDQEKRRFTTDVNTLESQLTVVACPQKKDMYVWREIFSKYMQACCITEIANEAQYTTASYEQSHQKFQLFADELIKANLANRLSSKQSKQALNKFLAIHTQLIRFKHFQALNQTAMIKILKKHDKRSGLSATSEFPAFAKSSVVFMNSILASILNIIQTKLVTIVPQPDDYDCPVCLSIAWRPIRLECGHVFCVRCLIKAHRKRLYNCPVCRQVNAVGNADANNLDQSLQNFMLRYFPKEIKAKRKENEEEQAKMDREKMQHNRQAISPQRIVQYQHSVQRNRTTLSHRETSCVVM